MSEPEVSVEKEKEFALTTRQAQLLLKHYEGGGVDTTEFSELKDLLQQIGQHNWTIEYSIGLAKRVLDTE
jgi:hypothetical protein